MLLPEGFFSVDFVFNNQTSIWKKAFFPSPAHTDLLYFPLALSVCVLNIRLRSIAYSRRGGQKSLFRPETQREQFQQLFCPFISNVNGAKGPQ